MDQTVSEFPKAEGVARVIDGKAFAAQLRETIKGRVEELKEKHGVTPGLAVILVGDDPASRVYVRNKGKQTVDVGMNSFVTRLPADTSEDDLITKIEELNADDKVHGILVQLPLPDHIQEVSVINAISPEKDVDGFHVVNTGKAATGQESVVPCTPKGCIMLLKDVLGDLSGLDALVIGRSNIVGKPMARLLLNENCTVTVAHSRTKNIEAQCKRADIIVAAVGIPEFVKGGWIKPGATVIDVGINRVPGDEEGKTRLVGDVEFDSAKSVAAAITPVPGGVGPMTIACLLANTLEACENDVL